MATPPINEYWALPAPRTIPAREEVARYAVHFPEHFIAPTGYSLEALLHFPLRLISVAGVKPTAALNLAERPFPRQSKVCSLPTL